MGMNRYNKNENMMPKWLKKGKSDTEIQKEDNEVKQIVSNVIKDIETHGDKAVRSNSEKFDKWSPNSFRLTESQIDKIFTEIDPSVIEDIKFAQQQIRNFASLQRTSIQDLEVETLPGVILGHKNIPVNSVGCYIPGGRYPMVASAHMSILTAKVAGVKRVIGFTPPINGEIPKAQWLQ
jgi:sulfopropanediol 3-dehydrogenase